MVNNEKFAKRLQQILDYYDLSAASFADEIQVGRSSISHILSGRNKPSLDFVMKAVSTFPEVDLYWLLNGKGDFPKKQVTTGKKQKPTDLFSSVVESEPPSNYQRVNLKTDSVKKIVIFYGDGSFEVYEND